jgi:hypothetical protein
MKGAIGAISLNKDLLSQKRDQNSLGIVKVMCCQVASGILELLTWIHLSVDFLPQEVQKRLLHVKHTFFDDPHIVQRYKKKPKKIVPQAIIFPTLMTILSLRVSLFCTKNLSQFPLSKKISLIFMVLDDTNSKKQLIP